MSANDFAVLALASSVVMILLSLVSLLRERRGRDSGRIVNGRSA